MRERPATKADLDSYLIDVFHRGCGGAVRRMGTAYQCFSLQCTGAWKPRVIERFSAQDIADRFVVRESEPRSDTVALVWVADPVTKQRHTKLVPLYESAGLERATS